MAVEITESDREKAFSLFDQGETPGRVSMLLFSGHWYKAKKLHDEFRARSFSPRVPVIAGVLEHEPVVADEREDDAIDLAEPGLDEEPETGEEGEAAVWDVTVQIPVSQMDRILSNFSPQEKADAIAAVLTARLSAED